MVRQAQGYFAAAVAAAVLNAAAIAAFVLITVLSSIHGLPLSGLLNASSPFQIGSSSSSAAPAADLTAGGLGGLDRRSSDFAASDRGASGGIDSQLSEARGGGGNPVHVEAGAGHGGPSGPTAGGSPGSGVPGPSGSGPSGSGPSGSGPTATGSSPAPSLPVRPPSSNGGSVGNAVQQVGNAASGSASAVQGTVGATTTAVTGVVAGATKGPAPAASGPVKAAGAAIEGVVSGAVKAVPSGPKPGAKAGGPIKGLPALP